MPLNRKLFLIFYIVAVLSGFVSSSAALDIEADVQLEDLRALKTIAHNAGVSLKDFSIVAPDKYSLKRDQNGVLLIHWKRASQYQPFITFGRETPIIMTDKNGRIIALKLVNTNFSKTELIKGLKHLILIRLRNNKIVDLNIDGHESLELLFLQDNGIEKITKLKNLPLVRTLNLDRNDIKRIENIKNLPKLTTLVLSNNQICKIENLNLPSLQILNLNAGAVGGCIGKMEGLSQLKHLKELEFSFQPITRIEGLSNLSNLEKLHVTGTKIQRVENIDHLKKLNVLSINKTGILELKGLENLTQLEYLYASECKIKKIEGLNRQTSLKHLDLSYNEGITRIEGLDTLEKLEKLLLNNTSIGKIDNLEKLKSLEVIELAETKVEKIEGLKNNLELKTLDLYGSKISTLENYQHLRKLKYFLYQNTRVNTNQKTEEMIKLRKFLWENAKQRKIESKADEVQKE